MSGWPTSRGFSDASSWEPRPPPVHAGASSPFRSSLRSSWWPGISQDPVWSTVLRGWVWRDGGPWFGVPLSNYLGWYLTVFTIYILFALFQRLNVAFDSPPNPVRDHAAILFYVLCALEHVAGVRSIRDIHRAGPHRPNLARCRHPRRLGLGFALGHGSFRAARVAQASGEAANPTG